MLKVNEETILDPKKFVIDLIGENKKLSDYLEREKLRKESDSRFYLGIGDDKNAEHCDLAVKEINALIQTEKRTTGFLETILKEEK